MIVRGASETSPEFPNRVMPELGGKSWNQLVSAFYARNFPSGCGLGFELIALASLVRALGSRRRR